MQRANGGKAEYVNLCDLPEGDALAAGDEGAACFFVDDTTVAATDGTGTRSKAGAARQVTAEGVWVRFDVALARAL